MNSGTMPQIFKLTLMLLLFLSLAACQPQGSGQTEIKFWAMGAEGEAVQQLVPRFERDHPGIRVTVQMFPWTAAQEKLITAFASDNLPDVFQLGNTWIPQFAALHALEPLELYVAGSESVTKSNYFPGIWDTNLIDSVLFGLPWYIDTRVLFYRSDVFRRAGYNHPPKTWAELLDVSRKIKAVQNDREKYAIYLPTNEWAPYVIFGLQNGADLLKEDGRFGDFSEQPFAEAFRFLVDFSKEGLSPLGVSQVTNVYQAFAAEYFVMYISGPWNIREFKKWMTGDLADKWMTAALPGPRDYPGLSLAGGASLVLSAKSQKKSAAWKFIEYLSQTQTQLRFFRILNDLPALLPAWQDSSLREDPYMQAFYEQFHHVVATPKVPEWEQIAFSKIQQYAELAARSAMTVEEALRHLDTDVDKILEKRRWLLDRRN